MGAPVLLSCNLSFLWQRTSGGSRRRQRMHIGGLPTLHHWLAQDLQVCVRRVIGRGGRAPRGAAVLAGREERASCRRAHGEAVRTRPGSQSRRAAGPEWGGATAQRLALQSGGWKPEAGAGPVCPEELGGWAVWAGPFWARSLLWEGFQPSTGLGLGRWSLRGVLRVRATAGAQSKVLRGADLWNGIGSALVGWGGVQPFAMDGARAVGWDRIQTSMRDVGRSHTGWSLYGRTESSLLLGAGPEQWGGITILLSMRDETKERGQPAETVVCPAFCYG